MMNKRNAEYWRRRFEYLEEQRHRKNMLTVSEIEKIFKQSQKSIEDQLRIWYSRFAENNQISGAEAKRFLNDNELEEFKWSVEEYIEYARENELDGQWQKQLENASAKVHISRLEALKIEMRNAVEVLYNKHFEITAEHLSETYKDTLYKGMYELQNGTGVFFDIAAVNQKQLEAAVYKSWTADNTTFSEKIWSNREKLIYDVQNRLTRDILTGSSFFDTIDFISKKYKTAGYNAGRLVMTESARVAAEADRAVYEDFGIEKVQIDETLDGETCAECRDIDQTVVSLSDYMPGVTVPPFHPWCRGTTTPYFDDEFSAGERRAARDPQSGRYYTVPADMTYREWEKTFAADGNNVLQNGGGNDIIKSLEADDFKMFADLKGIDEDVSNTITKVVQKYEKNNEIYISEFNFDSIASSGSGTVLLQIEPTGGGMARLNVNTDAFSGRTLEEINERIEKSKDIVANTLEEAVIHECGHAKSIYGRQLNEIKKMYDELAKIHIRGISDLAYSDGAEALAEMEILISRGEKLSKEAQELYDKYMRR